MREKPGVPPVPVDGIVLVCDRDGRVVAAHPVGSGVPGLTARADVPFPLLFGPDPLGRILQLLTELRRDGHVADRPVDGDRLGGALYVSGRTLGGAIVLAIAGAPGLEARLYAALRPVRPDLATLLAPLAAPAPMPDAEALFEEMARLNSQLTTAQRQLAKANADLAASNGQKARLLGMLAHDLRTPLQVISGFAWMVRNRLAGVAEQRDLDGLERIRESSLFMRHLIEDVLSLSALQAGRLTLARRPVDLGALVLRNATANEILALGRDLTLGCEITPGLPEVTIDPPRIEQVLNNLLSNAMKFSAPGGRVTVTVSGTASGVRVAIADCGQGIPEAEMENLFRPFSRTSAKAAAGDSSVGLGLFICRSIVEAHGGTIVAHSRPGAGSTFVFELPVGDGGAANPETAAPEQAIAAPVV